MEIQKIFSNIEDPDETLYSVLIRENEVALFSEFWKADKLRKLAGKITLGGLIYGGKNMIAPKIPKESTSKNAIKEQDRPSKAIGVSVKLSLPCKISKNFKIYGGPFNKNNLEQKISSNLDKIYEILCREYGYDKEYWKKNLTLFWIEILDSGDYALNFWYASNKFNSSHLWEFTINPKTNKIY